MKYQLNKKKYLSLNKCYIPSLDLHSIDKNKSSKNNQTVLIVLIVSIASIVCISFSFREYYRHRQHQHFLLSMQTRLNSSILDRYDLQQSLQPTLQRANETNTHTKTIHYPPQYSNDERCASDTPLGIVHSVDEPPSYKGKLLISYNSMIIFLLSSFFHYGIIDLFPN